MQHSITVCDMSWKATGMGDHLSWRTTYPGRRSQISMQLNIMSPKATCLERPCCLWPTGQFFKTGSPGVQKFTARFSVIPAGLCKPWLAETGWGFPALQPLFPCHWSACWLENYRVTCICTLYAQVYSQKHNL